MAVTSNFSIRIDPDVKAQSEYIYNTLGLNLTAAINVFLRKSIQTGGFPFDVRIDNFDGETIAAIKETDAITDEIRKGLRKPFDSWQEAKDSLLK